MKKEIREDIEKEIENKKIISNEIKQNIINQVFKNMIIAVAVVGYFYYLILGFQNIPREAFLIDLKVFSITLISLTIILFEIAYKQDSLKMFIYSLEVFVLSFITLTLMYICIILSQYFCFITLMLLLFFGIYYSVKSIILEQIIKKEYFKSLSDIKYITKKRNGKF